MPYEENSGDDEVALARRRLDQLDQQIIRVVKERVSFSALVQSTRIAHGGCRTDSTRENVVIGRYLDGLGPAGRDIGLSLLRLCRGRDPAPTAARGRGRTRRAFLGPAASVSHQAAEAWPGPPGAELLPVDSLEEAVAGPGEGVAEESVVPLENSVSGPVHDTLFALAATEGVTVAGQARLPVNWVLAAAPGTDLTSIDTVASHPHALAQTKRWLTGVLPRAARTSTSSTSRSAAGLLRPDAPYEAVICTRQAAEHYRLRVLACPERARTPVTRFVLVRPTAAPPAPTGNDVTSVVLTASAGALTGILECLTQERAEILGLHALPAGEASRLLWLDVRGHATDAHMLHVLSALHEHCERLRVAGTYPAAAPHDHQEP
ncbi:Prephenate dehydratase [Streptomyces formicae]|uniref:prephenate dehydratase n=2 Tax=Streptomyces formicae TaxID=1616117 RepID=A0A291QLR4_9ACTN|nr:Prephenate dehydratase [Streptomyces formicae]